MNKTFIKKITLILLVIVFVPFYVYAQSQTGIQNPIAGGADTIDDLITNAIQWMLSIIGLLSVLAIVGAGIMYVTAFVDEGQTQKAKKILIWAIVGLILAGASYAILSLVSTKILNTSTNNSQNTSLRIIHISSPFTMHPALASDSDSESSFQSGLDKAQAVDTIVGGNSIDSILKRTISTILAYAAVIGVLAVVIGGIMYITALGDDQKVSRAKNIIKYALIGLLICGSAFAIVLTVDLVI